MSRTYTQTENESRSRLSNRTKLLFLAVVLASCAINSVLPAQDSLLPPPLETENVAEPEPAPRVTPTTNTAGKSPREIYDETVLGTVWILCLDESGSGYKGTGFVIDKERRLIMTNHHVVDHTGRLFVYFPEFSDGQVVTQASHYLDYVEEIDAKIIDTDHKSDLAIIQADSMPDFVRELTLAEESARPADRVHAIGGNPKGSDTAFVYCNGSVRGIAVGGLASGYNARKMEADLDINPGNSGGAFVNDHGEVVAVCEGFRSDADGVKIAVDILEVHRYLDEIMPLLPANTAQKLLDFGNRHYFEGRYEVAITCFSHAIRKDPEMSVAYSDRGWSYWQLDQLDKALRDLNKAIQIDSSNVQAYRARSLVRRDMDQLDQALADINRAIAVDNQDPMCYADRGDVYYAMEDYRAAVNDYTMAIKFDDQNAEYFKDRADALQEINEHEAAIANLVRSIELNPNDDYTYFLMGYSHFYTSDYENALEFFGAAHQLDQESAFYLTWCGDAARKQSNLDLAYGLYSKAIELDETAAWAYYGRGLVLKAAGNQSAAQSDFNQAERLNPGITDYEPRGGSTAGSTNDSLLPDSFNDNHQVSHNSIVGVWFCEVTVNGVPARIAAQFDAQGNYAMVIKAQYDNGYVEEIKADGTYQFDGQTLTTHSSDGERETLRCRVQSDQMSIFLPDFNDNIVFERVES